MTKIKIDTSNPNLPLIRQVILDRMRKEPGWSQLHIDGLYSYIELSPPRPLDRQEFEHLAIGIFWDLVTAGIIAPGNGSFQPNFPWFRVTPYGRRVLETGEYQPHDRDGYIGLLRKRVAKPDATVLAYMEESLETFSRGNNVAAMVMLGVAAERVFDLLCDSISAALSDPAEQGKFRSILERYAMKPKLDWVHDKLCRLRDTRPRIDGLPENAILMITAIYELIRAQRNDLGHPRELPPRMSSGESHANLLIFPRYYEAAEEMQSFLALNRV